MVHICQAGKVLTTTVSHWFVWAYLQSTYQCISMLLRCSVLFINQILGVAARDTVILAEILVFLVT